MSQLSANFKRQEFACKCGCGFDTVDFELLEVLQKYSTILQEINPGKKVSIIINSGCRCATYNAKIKGAKNSQHVKGRAADIVVKINGSPVSPPDVAEFFHNNYPKVSTGIYPTFTHIDTRSGTPWRGINNG